jgi:hypothetical protein
MNFFDATLVTPTFERCVHECISDGDKFIDREQTSAHAEDVSIVVLARKTCHFRGTAIGSTNADDFVGDDRDANPTATEQNAKIIFTTCHTPRNGNGNIGVINRIFAERAEVVNLVSCLTKVFGKGLLGVVACVVSTESNAFHRA